MARITEKDLETTADHITNITHSEDLPYSIRMECGGYGLEKKNKHGGYENIFGLDTKKALIAQMYAFIKGISTGREL